MAIQKAYNSGLLQGIAYRVLMTRLTSVLAPFSLSIPEWKLLGQLAENGNMKLAKLAELLGVEAPLVTSLVDSLEKKKLVKRTDDMQDKRAKVIQGTRKAFILLEKIEPEIRTELRPLFKGVTPDDFATYMRVLQTIVNNSNSS